MFGVGEKVVYPVHGAGVIEGIETREILGEERRYYILKIYAGDLCVMIPTDTVEHIGMRLICDMNKLKEVDMVLRSEPSPWEDNWNRRYRQNMDKIKSGDICELAEVVRNLTLRDTAKGLSTGEKKMLDNARRILISEMMLSAEVSAEEATAHLDRIFCLEAE